MPSRHAAPQLLLLAGVLVLGCTPPSTTPEPSQSPSPFFDRLVQIPTLSRWSLPGYRRMAQLPGLDFYEAISAGTDDAVLVVGYEPNGMITELAVVHGIDRHRPITEPAPPSSRELLDALDETLRGRLGPPTTSTTRASCWSPTITSLRRVAVSLLAASASVVEYYDLMPAPGVTDCPPRLAAIAPPLDNRWTSHWQLQPLTDTVPVGMGRAELGDRLLDAGWCQLLRVRHGELYRPCPRPRPRPATAELLVSYDASGRAVGAALIRRHEKPLEQFVAGAPLSRPTRDAPPR